MWPGRYFLLKIMALLLSMPAPTVLAQAVPTENELLKLNADVVRTMTGYRESLEKLLSLYERDLQRQTEQVKHRRELYEKGYISRRELEESERGRATTEASVKETELKIAEAKIAITEAVAREELLRLPPLAAGEYKETVALVRYNGGVDWSLADAKKIEKFFSDTFGRLLPVSALGQTALHDRMKFDHRNAMDVAIHPDSSEGRALMAYLRSAGIPFIAFRNRVSGSATGAHIHIGKPSFRTVSP